VAVDHDDADLQHAVTTQRQPRGLDVDDRKAHGVVGERLHSAHCTPGVQHAVMLGADLPVQSEAALRRVLMPMGDDTV
jgi:hypothetical protein